METNKKRNLVEKLKAREPIITDFGMYLKGLRHLAGISGGDLAKALSMSPSTIYNIERGFNYPPSPAQLQIWLRVLGFSHKLGEATRLLHKVKKRRTINYVIRHEATEHIDRILDAYDNNTLSIMDIDILKTIAIQEYTPPDYRPSVKGRDTPDKKHPLRAKNERVTVKAKRTPKHLTRHSG